MATIYVGNLHFAVTELMLVHRFSPAGRVQSVHLCKDRKSGSSLVYAYINFQHRADAERALDMFNFEHLLNRPMHVMWSRHEAVKVPLVASTCKASVDEVQLDKNAKDELTSPAMKRLTIYMLESASLDEQVQMAFDHMLPLVEKIHPAQARRITWMLLEGINNEEVMNLFTDPEHLRSEVDKIDALLIAREAGVKPEILKKIFNTGNKKNKKKRRNKWQNESTPQLLF